ncbi:uncharacterized protein [Halyomorpha halys]|uniref:uncharacterized protein isoform X4 n=1 Tax=Halyomorpha halys TaxID=286706 RepID=UPI0006D4D317|nr:uncharacterized protein LOC106679953 isoform X5 [Halyomorpha halys]
MRQQHRPLIMNLEFYLHYSRKHINWRYMLKTNMGTPQEWFIVVKTAAAIRDRLVVHLKHVSSLLDGRGRNPSDFVNLTNCGDGYCCYPGDICRWKMCISPTYYYRLFIMKLESRVPC